MISCQVSQIILHDLLIREHSKHRKFFNILLPNVNDLYCTVLLLAIDILVRCLINLSVRALGFSALEK